MSDVKTLLAWDQTGEKLYETGVDRGVLYPQVSGAYPKGVAWSGLISINENPDGAEATDLYADNVKYLTLRSAETFGGTINAYMYPDEFAECNGEQELATGISIGQQNRKSFGLCYRTILGNDTDTDAYGYKIHIVYGASVSPSDKEYKSVNDSPEGMELSWEFKTIPVSVDGFKPTATVVIDSTKVDAQKLAALEQILYGTPEGESGSPAAVDARLPLPNEIASIFAA